MRARVVFLQRLLWLLQLVPTVALAGHGFVTAFGDIEWLPEPGRSPDSAWYWFDAWQEEGQLWLAHTPQEKVPLCLDFAREKLAELEAMIKLSHASAAETAADQYRKYVDQARHVIVDMPAGADKAPLATAMATALLEHQYILSIIYEELPPDARTVVPQVIAAAQERYQDITRLLSPKQKGALFFKEEEVRWSVQMALRVEEDGP